MEQRDRFAASCCGFRARLAANLLLAMVSPTILAVFAFALLLIFTGVRYVYVLFGITSGYVTLLAQLNMIRFNYVDDVGNMYIAELI